MASARATEVEARLEQLARDLQTDGALSGGQVHRHYGLSHDCLEDTHLSLVTAFLAPTQGSTCYREMQFVTPSPKLARLNAASLRHLAGVAELRRILGADPSNWQSRAAARYRPHTPDALWQTPRGIFAIEYDVGSYSRSQILRKGSTFRRYKGQIWGTPSRPRVRHLWHLLQPVDRRSVVIYASWD